MMNFTNGPNQQEPKDPKIEALKKIIEAVNMFLADDVGKQGNPQMNLNPEDDTGDIDDQTAIADDGREMEMPENGPDDPMDQENGLNEQDKKKNQLSKLMGRI